MEHLPTLRPPLSVPYLRHARNLKFPTFDSFSGSFAAYPSACGLGLISDIEPQALDAIVPVIQEWLFFGLLSTVFKDADVVYDRRDFLRVDPDGRVFVTTKNLLEMMRYWAANDVQKPLVEPIEVLQTASKWIHALFAFTKGSNQLTDNDIVLLSLSVLGETFWTAKRYMNVALKKIPWEFPDSGFFLFSGICRTEFENMRRNVDSPSYIYYRSFFDAAKKDHSRCEGSKICIANQVNEETYVTRHDTPLGTEECDCSHIFVDDSHETVIDILARGGIPVLRVAQEDDGAWKVTVQDSRDSSGALIPYISISHVWADGLGNPHQNSLPLCQLRRIQKYCNDLHGGSSVSFWIDTLCVPLVNKYRKLAIQRMANTYNEADTVLVLDASFQGVSATGSTEEILMRILFSSWATRVWTFQEGVLSKNLFFQFDDGTVNAHKHYYQEERAEEPGWKAVTPYLTESSIRTQSGAAKLARGLAYGIRLATERLLTAKTDDIANDPELAATWDSMISSAENLVSSFTPAQRELYEKIAQESPDDTENETDYTIWLVLLERAFPSAIRTTGADSLSLIIGSAYNNQIFDVNPGHRTPALHAHMLRAFLKGMHGRSTSRPEDETLCLGGIMDLDVGQLLTYDDGIARIKDFFRQMHSIPAEFVFSSAPKMQDEGFRWAPESFLSDIFVGMETRTMQIYQGTLGPRGLLLPLTVMQISREKKFSAADVATAVDADEVGYELRIDDGWARFEDARELSLVFNGRNLNVHAALVTLIGDEDGVLYVRYEANVRATKADVAAPDMRVRNVRRLGAIVAEPVCIA